LALISAPVTRYPFGSWYLCDDIKRIGSYIGGNEKRREEQGTCGRFVIVKVVQSAAKKDCITRTGTDIQAAKEPDRGIGSLK
jgi:hypothetical protein